jgi:Fic family protein
MAPSAERVNGLMFDLFDWLACSDEHPLILSSIFHYEFAFIHPFADGSLLISPLMIEINCFT